MAQLFSPRSDTVFRVVLVGVLCMGAALVISPMIYVRTPYDQNRLFPVDQPVQFDHRHHVQDDGIDCRYCHDGVETSPYAGIPSTQLCMGCHGQIWSGSPMLEPVRRSYFSGLPLPWNRVHHLPDFVYFNHSVHVNGGVACASCHGRVEGMALAFQVAPLSMGWCIDCHRERSGGGRAVGALTTCSACHR
jgi:hypothetical protein